jgi:hypothetical protein
VLSVSLVCLCLVVVFGVYALVPVYCVGCFDVAVWFVCVVCGVCCVRRVLCGVHIVRDECRVWSKLCVD